MKPLLLAASLVLAAAGLASAGAKKQTAVAIRFHAQGGAEGGNFSQKVTLLNSGREVYMQSMPLISEQEIKAFYPFQARDGSGTMGAYFKLDAHGNNLFTQHTMSRRGTYLLAFVNGRHVIDLYVNRVVNDGIIAIPSGLTQTDIARMELSLPVIGQENVKPGAKKKKKAKPAPDSAALPPVIPAGALAMQPAMRRQADGTLVPATVSGGAPAADMAQPSFSMVGQRR